MTDSLSVCSSGGHRRYNPLNRRWVVVSLGRTVRPWFGAVESADKPIRPTYDPDCYLCPGNARSSGIANPDYESTFSFTNDFPALYPDSPGVDATTSPLMLCEPVSGTCRVICFSPRHDLTLARMSAVEIRGVIDAWVKEHSALASDHEWVQLFENAGSEMGASIPHPHGQVWAMSDLPSEILIEDLAQAEHFDVNGTSMLLDYAEAESDDGARTVASNQHWIIAVPFWAVWPFETIILPRTSVASIDSLDADQRNSLASILKEILVRYDNLFESPFPYSMGWHGAPPNSKRTDHWQLHAHLYPPLLRSATVRKHMVGFELLAEAQRDLTAEDAAERLRSVSSIHYMDRDPT